MTEKRNVKRAEKRDQRNGCEHNGAGIYIYVRVRDVMYDVVAIGYI